MIAFFDTCIYIDFLRGAMPAAMYTRYFQTYIVRMCPVVYHELIRDTRSPSVAKRIVELGNTVRYLPPPTTPMWVQAAKILSALAPQIKGKAQEELQNDVLIALTARYNGVALITRDADFRRIRKLTDFSLLMHPSERDSA